MSQLELNFINLYKWYFQLECTQSHGFAFLQIRRFICLIFLSMPDIQRKRLIHKQVPLETDHQPVPVRCL